MSFRGLSAVAVLVTALFGTAQPAQTQGGSVDELAGLWKAHRWFGPIARGPLVIRRNGSSYTADMLGRTLPVRVDRGEMSFELPSNQGKFRGKLQDGGAISGYWNPPSSPTGMVRTSSVTLRAVRPNLWMGQIVVQAEDIFVFYLLARKRPDGSMGAFLRNPQRDMGGLWRVDRLVREGNVVKLIGKPFGQPTESDVAVGTYSPDDSVLTIDFPSRGGKYEFRREGDDSDFYPRGRNPAPYVYSGAPLARDDGWRTGTLDEVGIDRAAIEKMVQWIINTPMESTHNLQVDGVMIARHGKLVLEEYFHGEHRDKPHETRSASKSMTATLVGAAMYAGVPLRLSTPVYQIMNGGTFPADLDSLKRAMTLDHLLSMSSGYYCDDSDPKAPGNEDGMWNQPDEPDFYRFALRLPMASRPGEKAVYCSTNPNLALGLLGRATGESPLYTFDRLVAGPLKIRDYGWGSDPAGNPYGGGGAHFLQRDFMKIGQLMLNGGTWDGRRILSKEFVARASSPLFKLGDKKYGLGWWGMDFPYRNRTIHAFVALGNGGQNLFVFPDLDLVIAAYASNYGDRAFFAIGDNIVPKQILPAVNGKRGAMKRVYRPVIYSKARRILAALAAIAAFSAPLDTQEPRVFDGAPLANWIVPPGVSGDSFTVFHARRTFDLAAVPARFLVHVSADNRYRLYVNGVQVSSGPQRSDVTHWRYETLDLAPHLRAGRNVIAALVWNWGAARPVAQHSHRTGFLLQGNGPVEAARVNTGTGWKLLRDPAYAPIVITSATLGDYYAAAPGDSIDGSRYPWGWERADYVDDAWSGGVIVGRVKRRAMAPGDYGEVSGWQLEPRSIPPMEEREQRLARVRRATGVETDGAFLRGSGDLVIPGRTTVVLLLDQSHTTNSYPVIATSGGAGSMVRLTYAEALIDAAGKKGNRDDIAGRTVRGVSDVFLPDGGARRRFTTLYWRSFRYIQMDVTTADEPLRVHDLHGIFTAYPFAERARFASDLSWLADMWRMNWNGARIGAFETYMDTPYYEQLQYIGDTRVQGLISLYVAGDDRLLRQAIEHFDLSRIPEGITASRYPSALTQIIPPFSLIYVAMVHDYFLHRDDPAFVRERLAGVRGILDWFDRHVDATSMLGPMPYWNYVDWTPRWDRGVPPGADDGHSTTISLLYMYALQRAAELEEGVGMRAAGAVYRARAEAVRAAVRARAWNSARGLFRDAPDTNAYSQQTNVLAVLVDAVPIAAQRELMERIIADTTLAPASYYFSFYVLEALRKAGLGDRYIERLAPWQAMLRLGLTSAPENPEPTRSDSHAWAAHPNYGLLATVLGVRPSSPAFRTVLIAPALGPLHRAEGRVPHPFGDIDVQLVREGQRGLRAEITLPRGLSGVMEWHGQHRPLRQGRQIIRVE